MSKIATVAALLAAGALSCGAPRPRNTQCRELSSAPREVIVVEVDHGETSFAAPCPRDGRAYIDSLVTLRASSEGLRVRFTVRDVSFVPGSFREPRCERYQQGDHPTGCQRDAVVLFPAATLPGAPYAELELIPRAEGYRVDQLFPWSTWGLERGLGRLRFSLVVFERGPGGEENELRVVTILRVVDRRGQTSGDGGAPRAPP
jgi:hypothetical protein